MSEFNLPVRLLKGRGALMRHAHRFERDTRQAFDDGWQTWDEVLQGEPSPLPTELRWEDARSAITRNDSPDIGFDYSINPYRGCEHGCVYCYARTTHSYLGLSPGLDFERVLIAKRGLSDCLRRELTRPGYRPQTLMIGSATDCYQPVERRLGITRSLIDVLHQAQHPFGLITKSSGVERDLDLIAPMAREGLSAVFVTLTTLDAELARKLEPRAASPQRRLRTIRALADAGVPVGVSVAPQIPFLNEDMEQVLAAAADAGASGAFYMVLRLPWELNEVFQHWMQQHYPQRAARVMGRIREMRGGRDYDSDFATRMKGSGVWASLIRERFRKACTRHGLNQTRFELDGTRFRPALLSGQGCLF